jgi:hypothetical protein
MIETKCMTEGGGYESEGSGRVNRLITRVGEQLDSHCCWMAMPWFVNNYDAERNLSTARSLSCKVQLTNFKIRCYVHPSLEEGQARSHGKTVMQFNRLNGMPLMA